MFGEIELSPFFL